MIAESSLLVSAVEGKQIAKGEKVTAVVRGVENGIEMMCGLASMHGGYAESCNLASIKLMSLVAPPFFPGSIDFIPRVGYANHTFPV
jgi:hypothetical protein